ncbi:metallophosphoesterase [Thermococcus atlanticus]
MEFELFRKLSLEIRTSLGRTLLIADPHIAFEASRGLRIRTRFEERLADFINSEDPDVLIILGDVKEPLGMGIFTKRLLMGFFSELGDVKILITRGNHDGRIEEVAGKFRNIEVSDHFLIDDVLFVHGNRNLPDVQFEDAYLGHIHPAVSIKFGSTLRKTKCFLRTGRFLILPTINPYISGFDVKSGIKMIPFLKDAERGEVYLPEGVYLGEISLI